MVATTSSGLLPLGVTGVLLLECHALVLAHFVVILSGVALCVLYLCQALPLAHVVVV